MTDVVEELAKHMAFIRLGNGYWETFVPECKDAWKREAHSILTFLQPHITEREKAAWEAGHGAGHDCAMWHHDRATEQEAPNWDLTFEQWQAEQKGKV